MREQKFYMIVMLVEAIKIDKLVVNLRTQHQRSANEIRQKSQFDLSSYLARSLTHLPVVKQSMIEDDDIVAGPQKMSLRCPVSVTAI